MSSNLRARERSSSSRFLTHKHTNQTVITTFMKVCEYLNTPVALGVFLRLKHGMFKEVIDMKIDDRDYDDAESFRRDYQAVKGLSRCQFLPTGIDTEQAALDRFWEAEKRCAVSNRFFDQSNHEVSVEGTLLSWDPGMFSLLERARNLITKILGPVRSEDVRGRFGPGATDVVKRHITLPKKYARRVSLTGALLPYLPDLVGPLWMTHLHEVSVVYGNKVSFVDKNAKTKRAIAIEPHMNVYGQLAIGRLIKDRLSKYLRYDWATSGAELNRFLCSVAQSWQLCTVDLKAASDTIARLLVWYLLPEDWCQLLDTLRSPRFSIQSEGTAGLHYSEKFSSMGNGYTFELESLIFYALARAAGSSRALTNVWGDDIICEAHTFPALKRAVELCGFEINVDKSFHQGRFFESCGHDYYDGKNVRPFFWSNIQEDTGFKIVNDVARLLIKDGVVNYTEHWLWRYCVGSLNRDARLPIPDGIGDVGIVVPLDFAMSKKYIRRARNGFDGWELKRLSFKSSMSSWGRSNAGYLASLDSSSRQSRAPVRGEGTWAIRRTTAFGPWNDIRQI